MKLAIVNDVRLAVEVLRRIVVAAGHEVSWTAADGMEAVAACARDRPELVLMDLQMPVMNGVECTRRIMRDSPCPIIVVTTTVTGAYEQVYEAMSLGALDATDTPIPGDPSTIDRLLKKIATVGKLVSTSSPRIALPRELGAPAVAPSPQPPLLAIGASTGGPRAVVDVLTGLGPAARVAIVIVQHVDVHFAPGLARWMASQSGWTVELAEAGMRPRIGTALLAATANHLVLTADGAVGYTERPVDTPFRPSVDVLFKSASKWSARAAAVLLTGMGRDGARGLLGLRQAGWLTVAQDQATSVVYGMPRAAAELGAAEHILPILQIAPLLATYFRRP